MLGTKIKEADVLAILTVSYGLSKLPHPGQRSIRNLAHEISGHTIKGFFGASTQGVL